MIKIVFMAFSLLCCFQAKADENFYTRFDTSLTSSDQTGIKNGFAWRAGFGKKVSEKIRLETTVGYFRNDIKTHLGSNRVIGRLSGTSVFANVIIDAFDFNGFTPYVMGGAGFSYNKTNPTDTGNMILFQKHKLSPAWQTGMGIGISLPKRLTLDIGYVYTNTGNFELRGDKQLRDKDLRLQQFFIGLRYLF